MCDLLRKLSLTGFLLLVPHSAGLLRLVLALLLNLGYTACLQAAQPFAQTSTFYIAVATNVTLCWTLLAALLVKVHASMGVEHAALLFGAGDAFYLTVVILVANFGVLAGVLLLLLLAGSRTTLPRLRLTTTKAVPELTLAPSHKWHLFLRSACDRP